MLFTTVLAVFVVIHEHFSSGLHTTNPNQAHQ